MNEQFTDKEKKILALLADARAIGRSITFAEDDFAARMFMSGIDQAQMAVAAALAHRIDPNYPTR